MGKGGREADSSSVFFPEVLCEKLKGCNVVRLSRLTAASEFCRGGRRWPAAHLRSSPMLGTLENQPVSLNGV